MDDRTFKLSVGGGGAALVLVIVFLRFCGDLSVPPKPPPPKVSMAGATEMLTSSSESPAAWQAFLETDARLAGVAVPSPAAMARVLPHALDEKRRALAPGAPLEVAGLRLTLEIASEDGESDMVLVIENLGDSDLAYQVVTRPSGSAASCHARQILFYDANVVAAHRRERRSECVYRDGQSLQIDRVETVELGPLSAYYVSRLPAGLLTLDTRLTTGHKPFGKGVQCNVMMSQAIRSGLESGEIEWRDLVDFYARHRCDTYQFPEGYKAFKKNGERALPVITVTR